jgi:hypothetical protein
MDTNTTVELVITHERYSKPISVHYPLTPMQLSLLARAASHGTSDVPELLQDDLQDAIERVSKAATCVG